MTTRDVTTHTVGEVARMAGITVRTLHHYDEIGLLRPSGRSTAGYRLYTGEDLDRLQQVLFYRELGVGLDEIASALSRPGHARVDVLRRQKEHLEGRARRLDRIIAAVDAAIRGEETGIMLTDEEKLEVFGDFDPDEYTDEVEERWGNTDAYAESSRRAARYTKDDWVAIKAEVEDINARAMDAMQRGVDPTGAEAMDIAEAHRRHISERFYDCSPEMHTGLADMWLTDDRFRHNIDATGEGLTEFLAAAVKANAARIDR